MNLVKAALIGAAGYAAIVAWSMYQADRGSATREQQQKAEADIAYNVAIQSNDYQVLTNAIIKLQQANDPRTIELIARARSIGMKVY